MNTQLKQTTILRFRATIQIIGVNPYVHVSKARATLLKPGWKKPMPVRGRINGEPTKAWRINMMPIGNGAFYLYLHGEIRKASKTQVGDRVDVEIEFDEEYKNGPMHPMPDWFKSALRANAKATAAWDKLIPSRQKEVLRYFANLKTAEAQARNLARAIKALSDDESRFMGRTWKDGA